MGANKEGKKELVARNIGYRERKVSWWEVLLNLRRRRNGHTSNAEHIKAIPTKPGSQIIAITIYSNLDPSERTKVVTVKLTTPGQKRNQQASISVILV